MAELCSAELRQLKVAQIVLAALTACGALSIIFADPVWLKIATALLSFVALSVSGYMKGFDPGGLAQKHRDAAVILWDIRESYLSLLTDLRRGSLTDTDAAVRRDELQARLAKIYEGVPQTSAHAYAKAQVALQKSQDYTFSTEELDQFVPESLRKTAK